MDIFNIELQNSQNVDGFNVCCCKSVPPLGADDLKDGVGPLDEGAVGRGGHHDLYQEAEVGELEC